MNVTFYKFSKRKNSTKRPTASAVEETYNVYLKDGCSTEHPVFMIDGINLSVNYCYWNNAYYFVDEIVLSNNNIYEIRCSIDVLATFKTTIGSSSQFIARAQSAFDPMVNDDLISTQQDIVNVKNAITYLTPIGSGAVTGCYLLQTMSVKGVNVYGYDDLDDILGILNNNAYGITNNQLANLVQTIGLNMLDVSAYVSNIMWVPFPLSALTGQSENVCVSFWELNNFTAKKITQRTITDSGTIAKPVNDYSDFRANNPRFSTYNIYLPGVGCVGLGSIENATDLTYSMTFDLFTGNVQYILYNSDGTYTRMIGNYSGQLGVPIPYSTTRIDTGSILQSVMTPSPSFGGGGGYAAAASAAANTTWDVVNAVLEPQTSFNSSAGNMSEIRLRPYIMLSLANYGSKDFLTNYYGRPLCEVRQISTLSGYIKCNGASLESSATGTEKDLINSYLNGGFYYE